MPNSKGFSESTHPSLTCFFCCFLVLSLVLLHSVLLGDALIIFITFLTVLSFYKMQQQGMMLQEAKISHDEMVKLKSWNKNPQNSVFHAKAMLSLQGQVISIFDSILLVMMSSKSPIMNAHIF